MKNMYINEKKKKLKKNYHIKKHKKTYIITL